MKVEQLFEELEKIKETSKPYFEISGMVNRFNEMQYGFFPLGLGILTENNKIKELPPTTEIEGGGVMILGNDFGTVSYVDSYVNNTDKEIGETDSKTISNLLKRVDLSLQKTFFTNFYLGIRTNESATMIKRVEVLNDRYKELCFQFFKYQLNLLNPSIVICLGHDVRNALIDSVESSSFTKWLPKSITFKALYNSAKNDYEIDVENEQLGTRKFIVIPHPSYIVNLKKDYMAKINAILAPNKDM